MSQPSSSLPQLLAPLNQAVKPLIQAGFGNPLLFTPGVTVLEVQGRRSGVLRTVPLSCYFAGGAIMVGTVRRQSQWIKNLAAADVAHIWLWGNRYPVKKIQVTDHSAWLSINWSAQSR